MNVKRITGCETVAKKDFNEYAEYNCDECGLPLSLPIVKYNVEIEEGGHLRRETWFAHKNCVK